MLILLLSLEGLVFLTTVFLFLEVSPKLVTSFIILPFFFRCLPINAIQNQSWTVMNSIC